jgi:hypothetical protein
VLTEVYNPWEPPGTFWCLPNLIRLSWTDSRGDDSPVDWRAPALILATLFFNFFFWFEPAHDFPSSGPPRLYFGTLIGSALLTVGLFYLGPAHAAQASKMSLFDLVAASVGSVPTWAFRACCTLFSIGWIYAFVGTTLFTGLKWPYRRSPTTLQFALVAVAATALLFLTALQGLRTNGRLAFFTNKLAIALLIAGLIRVRGGLPSVWDELAHRLIGRQEAIANAWLGLGAVLAYAAPWALLAANFGVRLPDRRQIVLTGYFGIALPIIVSIGVSEFASAASPVILNFRNIAGALWYHDSSRFLPPMMALAAMTIFGSARFGIRTLAETLSPLKERRLAFPISMILSACGITALVTSIMSQQGSFDLLLYLGGISRALGIVAGILTADALTRTATPTRRFDWIGILAFLSGWAAPWYLPDSTPGTQIDEYHQPWLLASYAIAFAVCAAGRLFQRLRFPHLDPT